MKCDGGVTVSDPCTAFGVHYESSSRGRDDDQLGVRYMSGDLFLFERGEESVAGDADHERAGGKGCQHLPETHLVCGIDATTSEVVAV